MRKNKTELESQPAGTNQWVINCVSIVKELDSGLPTINPACAHDRTST